MPSLPLGINAQLACGASGSNKGQTTGLSHSQTELAWNLPEATQAPLQAFSILESGPSLGLGYPMLFLGGKKPTL